MTLSFLCPHCSRLFEANPEVFGQTCACAGCGGFFTVPAPLEKGYSGQGLDQAQEDERGAISSLLAEKESLSQEANSLRGRLSLKEREFSEIVVERNAIRERSELSAKAHKQLEADLAESQKALIVLRSELEAGSAALKIAEEAGKGAAKHAGLLEQKLREAQFDEQRFNASLQRIELLTAECAKGAKELELEKARNNKIQADVQAVQEERDTLVAELKQSNLQGVQSVSRLSELEKETQTLSAKVIGLSGAEGERRNSELKLKEAEEKLAELSLNEKRWHEKFQQHERGLQESCVQIAELETALVRSNADCEVLRTEVQKQQAVLHQTTSALEKGDQSAKDSIRLLERISDLETRLREAGEKETGLARQLDLKGEELAAMHHRLLLSDHGDRSVPHFGGVLSDALNRLHELLLIVERQIGCVFGGFALWDRSLRLGASVAVCFVLGTLLVGGGFLSLSTIRGARGHEPAPAPSDLVHAMPVLRELHEEVSKGISTEHVLQRTDTAPAPSEPSPQASSAESSSGRAAESAAPPPSQAVKPTVESEESDAPMGLGRADLAVGKAPVAAVNETHEGKETIKNLSRASLPNQFLGTQFGTALSDVANLSHWTESNGRLRRKATLVGAAVEAVLIPNHENRVMAGAYVRVCPRSTESLAQFLEWAVGVQDAVDAEYGEPSTVHEVSEADDAAAVVERIANGKDFYEATWERQSDDGFIVLSIRVFNERSVVFRLEYLNRQLLSEYTAQQRTAAQPEPGVAPEN